MLNNFSTINLSTQSRDLLERQITNWDLANTGYSGLKDVRFREFDIDGNQIKVQFNPGRMVSTTAKVDAKSIKERPCFLCSENLPAAQEKLRYNDKFNILVNPFPIFPEHFTIPHVNHTPQLIKEWFPEMLNMARDLSEKYLVFYNGPNCGASAPDHMHFQAGTKHFMPLDAHLINKKDKHDIALYREFGLEVYSLDDGLRKMIGIDGVKESAIIEAFNSFYKIYSEINPGDPEPMMNIVCIFYPEWETWRTLILLREKHRPAKYFAEGNERIMLSPAAVDLGGVGVIPVQEDFERINPQNITEIFHEVFISEDKFSALVEKLRGLSSI